MIHGPTAAALATISAASAMHGWRWCNGFHDTSGYGGGPRSTWLGAYPAAKAVTEQRATTEPNHHPYRVWFLGQNTDTYQDVPLAAVDIAGTAWIAERRYDLTDPDQRSAFIGRCIYATNPGLSTADPPP